MADPLSVSAGIVGLVATALHGTRLLLNDLERIVDAPEAVERLKEDVNSVGASLGLLKDIGEIEWASLGSGITQHSKTTIQSCETACDTIRGDLQRWTKRSKGKTLSWLDRLNVGFFKDHQLKALSSQLQTYKRTFNSVVSTATLYSSIHNTRMTEELRNAIALQHRSIESASSSTETEIATVERALGEVHIGPSDDSVVDDEERDATVTTLEELTEALRLSQALLSGLSSKAQEKEVERAAESSRGTKISFGKNNKGMQIGVGYGPITWNGTREDQV